MPCIVTAIEYMTQMWRQLPDSANPWQIAKWVWKSLTKSPRSCVRFDARVVLPV